MGGENNIMQGLGLGMAQAPVMTTTQGNTGIQAGVSGSVGGYGVQGQALTLVALVGALVLAYVATRRIQGAR